MKKRILVLFVLLALLISACTVYVDPGRVNIRARIRFGIEVSDIITVFEPDRGMGATYRVGEDIGFRIRTTGDGYITLSAIDPDGSVYVFARNIFVRGNVVNFLPPANSRVRYKATPPRGFHRVRASFTPTPTNTTRIRYIGRSGEDAWTQSIVAEIEPHPVDVRDIAETNLYIR
jgi:hypothetical protein